MAKTNEWEMMVDDWADTDPVRVAVAREIAAKFTSMLLLVNHARGLLKQFREDEKARVFPNGMKGVPVVVFIVWRMLESRPGDAG